MSNELLSLQVKENLVLMTKKSSFCKNKIIGRYSHIKKILKERKIITFYAFDYLFLLYGL